MKNWLKRILQGIIYAALSFVENIQATLGTYHYYAAIRHEYKAIVAFRPDETDKQGIRRARFLLERMEGAVFEEDAFSLKTRAFIYILIVAAIFVPAMWIGAQVSKLFNNSILAWAVSTVLIGAGVTVTLGEFVTKKAGDMLANYRIKKLRKWLGGPTPCTDVPPQTVTNN